MKLEKIKDLFETGHLSYLPNLSVDCCIFGFHDNNLKVLLLKLKKDNGWVLPGGYVSNAESLEQSATRTLEERTGLTQLYLKQFHTFGDPNRTSIPGKGVDKFAEILDFEVNNNGWLFKRFVSVGYYALVEYSKVTPTPDAFSDECKWWDIKNIPELLFDHNNIVDQALRYLRNQIYFQPIGLNLLPERFTLPQLQGVYETILDKKLDRRNFQKKILGLDILDRLEERKNIGPHRSPFLYSFNKEKYEEAKKEGISFAF